MHVERFRPGGVLLPLALAVQLAAQRWPRKKARFSFTLVIFGPAFTKKKSGQSEIYSTKRFNDVFTPLRFGKINCGADSRARFYRYSDIPWNIALPFRNVTTNR